MLIQQINGALLAAAAITSLTITTPVIADSERQMTQSEENLQLVIRYMTEDFRAFGICGEQAKMLAEQTADFGTSGIMTTIAAVGIIPLVVNIIATNAKPCPREL
jgi:type II secretory pathway component PulJ